MFISHLFPTFPAWGAMRTGPGSSPSEAMTDPDPASRPTNASHNGAVVRFTRRTGCPYVVDGHPAGPLASRHMGCCGYGSGPSACPGVGPELTELRGLPVDRQGPVSENAPLLGQTLDLEAHNVCECKTIRQRRSDG